MLVLRNQRRRINVLFRSSHFLYHPHTQTRIILVIGFRKNISNLKLFPNRAPMELSNCLSHMSTTRKQRQKFAQEEISIISEHLSFLPAYKQTHCRLLVLPNPAVWIWYSWLLLPSFVMLVIFPRWILHKIQNYLLQYHRGGQLDLCTFGALVQSWRSWNDSCLFPHFNDHLFFVSDFRQVPHRNHKIAVVQWVYSFPCNMISMTFATNFLIHYCSSCKFLLASELPTVYAHVSKSAWILESMKRIPRNFATLSNFGFSIAHFLFIAFPSLRRSWHLPKFLATESGLEIVHFLVNLFPDHFHPVGFLPM